MYRSIRPNHASARLAALAVLVVIAGVAVGCGRSDKTILKSLSATGRITRTQSTPSIRTSREYSDAAAAFSRGDKRGALARTEHLLNSKTLTSSDREFLTRQREICLVALGERGKARGASTPSGRARNATAPVADCGPRALAIAARSLGVKTDAKRVAVAGGTTRYGTTLEGLAKAAETIGLAAEGVHVDGNALKQLDTPAISWVDGDHFLVVLKVEGDQATVHDPNQPREEAMETNELMRRSGGILLKLRKL